MPDTANRQKPLDAIFENLIGIDLDGTLALMAPRDADERDFKKVPIGVLQPGAISVLKGWKDRGYKIYIFTVREHEKVVAWLKANPAVDELIEFVSDRKHPQTIIYIDDRGFRHNGDWDTTEELVNRLLTYHQECKKEFPLGGKAL